MLPETLQGPGKVVYLYPTDEFLKINSTLYPNLDRDFILQICFEHPIRFDERFPGFDPKIHSAVRKTVKAKWIYETIRYDNNDELDFWYTRFDGLLKSNEKDDEIFSFMVENKVWPFPPVVVEENFGKQLACPYDLGRPFHLIEGTHRVSYLRRMIEIGMIKPTDELEIIEIEIKKSG